MEKVISQTKKPVLPLPNISWGLWLLLQPTYSCLAAPKDAVLNALAGQEARIAHIVAKSEPLISNLVAAQGSMFSNVVARQEDRLLNTVASHPFYCSLSAPVLTLPRTEGQIQLQLESMVRLKGRVFQGEFAGLCELPDYSKQSAKLALETLRGSVTIWHQASPLYKKARFWFGGGVEVHQQLDDCKVLAGAAVSNIFKRLAFSGLGGIEFQLSDLTHPSAPFLLHLKVPVPFLRNYLQTDGWLRGRASLISGENYLQIVATASSKQFNWVRVRLQTAQVVLHSKESLYPQNLFAALKGGSIHIEVGTAHRRQRLGSAAMPVRWSELLTGKHSSNTILSQPSPSNSQPPNSHVPNSEAVTGKKSNGSNVAHESDEAGKRPNTPAVQSNPPQLSESAPQINESKGRPAKQGVGSEHASSNKV